MLEEIYNNLKIKKPLVHCITNYVTANDCANILLAINASPIMASYHLEVAEITEKSDALSLNIGTPNENTTIAMINSIVAANNNNLPITLDLVGLGVSSFRQNLVKKIITNFNLTAIKGNASEIFSLYSLLNNSKYFYSKGVDTENQTYNTSKDEIISIVSFLATKLSSIIICTGKEDIISDGTTTYLINNGSSLCTKITGAGCMLNCIIAAFLASTNKHIEATLTAATVFNVSAQLAEKKLTNDMGNASFRAKLIDEMYKLNINTVKQLSNFKKINIR